MAYKKFRADYLFTGKEMLGSDFVLVTDNSGIIEAIMPKAEAGEEIQVKEGMLTPGFINCHYHLELSHLKNNVPEGTGLVDFLVTVIQQRGATEEVIIAAARQALQELYDGGTVAVGDICNTAGTVMIKEQSNLRFYNFIECLAFTQAKAHDRFVFADNVQQQFNDHWPVALVPHSPYSVSRELFALINDAASGKTITIHNQECMAEEILYKNGNSDLNRLYAALGIDISFFKPSGKSSVQTYLPWLSHAKQLILVHNTYTSGEDISFITAYAKQALQQIYFCLCPNANKYIEARLPPVEMLQNGHCNIVIGTDSYASNKSLHMLDEIKTLQQELHLPVQEVLQWATINGARALQMDNVAGSFEKGKQPGIVWLDKLNGAHFTAETKATRIL